MDSKQTDNSQEKKEQLQQPMQDWMPTSTVGKTRSSKLAGGYDSKVLNEFLRADKLDDLEVAGKDSQEGADSISNEDTIQLGDRNDTTDSLQTESEATVAPSASKRTSGKQRKESLEEYRQTFLSVPKLEDRKPVFISREVRDKLDEIARKLGGRGRSVSGFIENLARHHLETYREDVELWKKL
ncbi:MAG: hypothetical protein BGN96_03140 [Bacteroidales bacterium 45-6]|uniref:DUF3408 domain-containing protein n=1 Tax=uncultured Dysgonomonas sp. TaxID=206096 RepID=UPI00096663AF|nr:DUF3408 domain-containing protein [uncultured Dysgonomonas sp.]OJU38621.1 MAG: hypothetical protein BGN96_03140 [Bacteroidales bacterium 45-6]